MADEHIPKQEGEGEIVCADCGRLLGDVPWSIVLSGERNMPFFEREFVCPSCHWTTKIKVPVQL